MPRVHLPDGRVVNFPDGMSEADISKAMAEIADPQSAQPSAPEGKSLAGFGSNVLSSGKRFLSDMVTGLPQLVKIAGKGAVLMANPGAHGPELAQLGGAIPRIAGAAKDAAVQRYGSPSAIGETLYNDPVGALADVSTLAGGVGLAGKLARAPRIARIASTVSEATNPLRAITAPVNALAHEAGNIAVRGTLRAPKAVREDFGGGRAVADAVLKERTFSAANAGKKLDKSVARADRMLADAQAAGVPGVPRVAVARSVLGEPAETAKLRTRLGVPDATPELTETAKGIFRNNQSQIPLTDAQAMKREAQTLAYEAGAENQTVKKAAEIAKAKALRAGIEHRVPEVGPVNEQSSRLLGAQRAFAEAEDRPRNLTNFLSVLGAGGIGASTGDPMSALLMAALIKGMDSPRAGAMAGIGVNSIGQGLNAAGLRKAALLARLTETSE